MESTAMTPKHTALLCSISLFCAGILFAFWQEWLIVRIPQRFSSTEQTLPVTKREVALWYWQQNRMHSEQTQLLWSPNVSDTIAQLMSASLVVFEEAGLLDKKTVVQSVALTSDGLTALISFDRAPLKKQASVYTKWMTIEALLKTLKSSGIKIQHVQFLTHHQPMQDAHLDFSHAWPVSGFTG